MRQALIFVLLALSTLNGWAQSRGAYKRANALYQKFAYADAIEAYEKIYRGAPADSISIKIARSHERLNQPEQVVIWYRKVKSTDQLTAEDIVHFADDFRHRSGAGGGGGGRGERQVQHMYVASEMLSLPMPLLAPGTSAGTGVTRTFIFQRKSMH